MHLIPQTSGYDDVFLFFIKVCEDNYYGSGCSQRCSRGCVRRTCNHINGTCQCQPGHTGSKCLKSKNFYDTLLTQV